MKPILFLSLLIAAAAAQNCGFTRRAAPPTNPFVSECDGIRYYFTVPDACVTQSCPLLFDAHGFTMTADGQNEGSNLRNLGYTNGFIVVNPEKPNRIWVTPRDHPAVFNAYAQVVSVYNVNRNRTHFTGFSMGGLMTWDAGCKMADTICSIAPLAASGYDWWAILDGDCWSTGRDAIGLPARVPDVLYGAGRLDKLATWPNAQDRRDDVLELYNTTYARGTVLSEDNLHIWTEWNVNPNIVFQFIEHEYSAYRSTGHCFPGGDDRSPFTCKNDPNPAFAWGEAVIDFFINHPC